MKFKKKYIIGLHLFEVRFVLVRQRILVLFHAKFFYSETDYSFKNFRQIRSIPGLQLLFNEIVKKHQSYIDWQKNQQEQSQARDDEDEVTHEEEDPLMRPSKGYQRPTTTSRENAPQKSTLKTECEFELFMSHPHFKNEKSINPLEWWKKKSEFFPLLSGVAKKWFCIPASSATSKR